VEHSARRTIVAQGRVCRADTLNTPARSRKPDRARPEAAPRIRGGRLEEMIKHGYVERVGNAYRVTDKVNIPDLQKKLQRRIDMVAQTAKRLADLSARAR
jgi:hypothetical protein